MTDNIFELNEEKSIVASVVPSQATANQPDFSSDPVLQNLQPWLNQPGNLEAMQTVIVEFQKIIEMTIDQGDPNFQAQKILSVQATGDAIKDFEERRDHYLAAFPKFNDACKFPQGYCKKMGPTVSSCAYPASVQKFLHSGEGQSQPSCPTCS